MTVVRMQLPIAAQFPSSVEISLKMSFIWEMHGVESACTDATTNAYACACMCAITSRLSNVLGGLMGVGGGACVRLVDGEMVFYLNRSKRSIRCNAWCSCQRQALTGVLATHSTIYLGRSCSLPFAYS